MSTPVETILMHLKSDLLAEFRDLADDWTAEDAALLALKAEDIAKTTGKLAQAVDANTKEILRSHNAQHQAHVVVMACKALDIVQNKSAAAIERNISKYVRQVVSVLVEVAIAAIRVAVTG